MPGPAEAFHSIQDRGRGIVSLRAIEKDLPEQAHGPADIRLYCPPVDHKPGSIQHNHRGQ